MSRKIIKSVAAFGAQLTLIVLFLGNYVANLGCKMW